MNDVYYTAKEQTRYKKNAIKSELREYRKSKRQEEREALRKVIMGEIDEDEIDVYEEKKAINEDWQ